MRPDDLMYGAFADAPLTRLGSRQAERTGQALAGHSLAAVCASSYRRAVMTAQEVARRHNLPVVRENAFVERDFGEWDGLTAGEIAQRDPPGVPLLDTSGRFAPPGGESLERVVERAHRALRGLAEAHAGACVLVVSHKTLIRAVLCHLLGVPLERFRRLGQDNCALNVLAMGPGHVDVSLINDTCHLEGMSDQCA